MTASDMFRIEKENQSPAEELHHISEQLDELIRLIRNSTELLTGNIPAEPAPSNDEVMTVKEAARMLKISLPKMYELARSGRIHILEVGRRILISRSSLMALLREGE